MTIKEAEREKITMEEALKRLIVTAKEEVFQATKAWAEAGESDDEDADTKLEEATAEMAEAVSMVAWLEAQLEEELS